MKPVTLTADFRFVTPAFLGGAELVRPELRPPSIKGALRLWYRALDPEFARKENGGPIAESALFGGAEPGAGQSRILLAVTGARLTELPADRIAWDRFAQGSGRFVKNGLAYLGYPFKFARATRTAFAPGSTFTIRLVLRPGRHPLTEREARGLVAALWALGHVGGLGSRSRRGFGGLSLEKWAVDGDGPAAGLLEAARSALPLAATFPNAEHFRGRWKQTRALLSTWFGTFADDRRRFSHPHFGPRARGPAIADVAFTDPAWDAALNAAGRALQNFRVRKAPDYDMVKSHLLRVARQDGDFLRAAPPRVTFGLPLTFRYGSLHTKPSDMTFVPYPAGAGGYGERQGSLLLVRLIRLADGLHPVFFRMDGAVPGIDVPAGPRHQTGQPLPSAPANALDQFMDSME